MSTMARRRLWPGVLLSLVGLGCWSSAATGAPIGTRAPKPAIRLEVPSGLALAPNGDLFIADQWLQQIVERLPNGVFRVVAGTGKEGFSGDGGAAVKAELDTPTSLVRAPNGTLYFVDSGNRRIRAVLPNGKMVTVAGGGPLSANSIVSGTEATEVSFYPSDLAIGPNGDLYVTADDEVLRLSPAGVFTEVADSSSSVGVVSTIEGTCGPDGIAFDSSGRMWLGCDNSRQLVEERSPGRFSVIANFYRPHDFPGMASGQGSMIVVDGEGLVRYVGDKSAPILDLNDFNRSDFFVPSGVAVSANGTVYVDSRFGDGFTFGASLGEISPAGRFTRLGFWKVNCATNPSC